MKKTLKVHQKDNLLVKAVKDLIKENSRYREALRIIAEGNIAPSSISHNYIDEAYQVIARRALKSNGRLALEETE